MLEYRFSEQVVIGVFLAIAILTALVLKLFLKDKEEKYKRLPLIIISVIIIIFEVFKQIKNATGYDSGSFVSFLKHDNGDSFSTYAFPFHFCSFFVFWPILAACSKGKVREFFNNMTFLWSALITLYTLIYPISVMGNATEDLFNHNPIEHTTIFHMLVMLYCFVAVALRTYKFTAKKFWVGTSSFGIFSLFAMPAAFIFDSNYCSMLQPDGFPFLFPIQQSSYVLYEMIIVAAGCIFCTVVYLAIVGIEKLRDKVKNSTPYCVSWLVCGLTLPFVIFCLQDLFGADALAPLFTLKLALIVAVYILPAFIYNLITNKKVAKAKE